MLLEAMGICSGSATTVPPGSRASGNRYEIRLRRRKSMPGSPTWTARKPKTSSTALSIWPSSQSST